MVDQSSRESCRCFTGSQFTGTAINPARALGPAIVFHCHWNEVWLYIIAGMFPVIAGMFPVIAGMSPVIAGMSSVSAGMSM